MVALYEQFDRRKGLAVEATVVNIYNSPWVLSYIIYVSVWSSYYLKSWRRV